LNRDTYDKHDEGIWAGWVFHSLLDGTDGSSSPDPVFITVDSGRREVSFGTSKKRPDVTHKF